MKQFLRNGGRTLGGGLCRRRPAPFVWPRKAGQRPTAAAGQNRRSALDFVPADAVAVLSVRVADLWKHPAGKAIREKLRKDCRTPSRRLAAIWASARRRSIV